MLAYQTRKVKQSEAQGTHYPLTTITVTECDVCKKRTFHTLTQYHNVHDNSVDYDMTTWQCEECGIVSDQV